MKIYFIIPILLISLTYSCIKENVSEISNETSPNSNTKSTGSSSNDLLSDKKYKSMVIELAYVDGFKPSKIAINNFKSFLEARTHKPNGIIIQERTIESLNKTSYTIDDIIEIEENNRTLYNTNDQIVIWAFFSDGSSSKDSGSGTVLGTAYRNTSFVIFENTIHQLSNSAFDPSRSLLETTVITHEFGHILGLTDLGAEMQTDHEDKEHTKHCNVESCLMYWSAETGDGLSNLFGNSTAPTLDDQCIADLQANGGK